MLRRFSIGILLLAGYAAAPFVVGDRYTGILALAAIYTIVVAGLNIFMGYTGQVSFGHNAFVAIGGYASAILTTDHGWPPLTAMVVAVVLSMIGALLIGVPILRLRGRYLAMGTFALGLIAVEIATQWKGLTKGSFGIAGIPPLGIGGFELSTDRQYFYVYWLLAAAVLYATARIRDARVGRAFRAIAGDEQAARALSIDVTRYKLLAFVTSAGLSAFGGSLMAHYISFVSPEAFDFGLIILLFSMIYVGGVGTTFGPVLGAMAMSVLPEALRSVNQWRESVYGVLVLLILIFVPRGLYALKDFPQWRLWRSGPHRQLPIGEGR